MKNPPSKIAEAYLQKYTKPDGTLMTARERESYDSKLRSEIDSIRSDELHRKRREEAANPKSQKQQKLDYFQNELGRVYSDKERRELQKRIKAAQAEVDIENAAFEREHEIATHPGTMSVQEYLASASLQPEQRWRLEAIQSFYHDNPTAMHKRFVESVAEFRAEDKQRAEKAAADMHYELLKTQAEASQKVLDVVQSEQAADMAHTRLAEATGE